MFAERGSSLFLGKVENVMTVRAVDVSGLTGQPVGSFAQYGAVVDDGGHAYRPG